MSDEVLSSRSSDADEVEDEVLSQESAVEDDPDTDPDLIGVDITGDLDPEDFDIEAFVSGLRPARRAVVIRNHHLRYLIDQVRDEIEARRYSGEDLAEAEATLDEAVAEFLATGRTFVIGAWSTERVAAFEKELKGQGIDPFGTQVELDAKRKPLLDKIAAASKKQGFDQDRLAEMKAQLDAIEKPLIESMQQQYRDYLNHRIAAQIVSPRGVTPEHIRKMTEVDEPAVSSLWKTLEETNSDRRVTRDFSQLPSGRRRSG